MQKIEELKEKINTISQIEHTAKTYFNDFKYLINPDTSEEKWIVEKDEFIKRTINVFAEISAIKICKLFGGKGDEYTFEKLLTKMQREYENSEWKEKISKNTINSLEIKLHDTSTQERINNIRYLRDKYFVHSDREPDIHITELFKSFTKDMEYLFGIGDKIISEITTPLELFYWWETTDKANGILGRLATLIDKK